MRRATPHDVRTEDNKGRDWSLVERCVEKGGSNSLMFFLMEIHTNGIRLNSSIDEDRTQKNRLYKRPGERGTKPPTQLTQKTGAWNRTGATRQQFVP